MTLWIDKEFTLNFNDSLDVEGGRQRAEESHLVGLHAALDLGLGQCHPFGFGRGFDPRPLVLLPFRRSPPPLVQPVGRRGPGDLFRLLLVIGKRWGTTVPCE